MAKSNYGEAQMYGNDRLIYPMLGVGAFFAMFWVGVIVSYELGLSCLAFFVNGVLFACLGASLVARLECRAEAESGATCASRARSSQPRLDRTNGALPGIELLPLLPVQRVAATSPKA